MADFKLRLPNRVEENTIEKRIDEVGRGIDERAILATIETAKNSQEATEKITNMVMESLDVSKFKERLIEESLKDPELRNKIMLELIKKL